MTEQLITVEVAYALPDRQQILSLEVEEGTSALEAVRRSGITDEFPEIDPDKASMGIFSRVLDGKVNPSPAEYRLKQRDRVEIYRPLQMDPKQARLARAADRKNRQESTDEQS